MPTDIDTISYRDAYDRANRFIHSEKAAIKAMQDALLSGDEVMARAITALGRREGWNVALDIQSAATEANEALLQLASDRNSAVAPLREERLSGRITDLGVKEGYAALAASKGWEAQLDNIVTKAHALIHATDRTLESAIGRLTNSQGDTQSQLLAEMRVSRAWNRVREEIDARAATGASRALIMDELIRGGADAYELTALIAEGPSYARTHGEPEAIAVIHAALAAVDSTIGEAVTNARTAHQFETVLHHNAALVRTALTSPDINDVNIYGNGYLDLTAVDYTS